MSKDKTDFVTVCRGMGFFASHWSYVEEDGFHQPWSTVGFHHDNVDGAERDAKAYAESIGVRFIPWDDVYRTLDEARRYDAIYAQERDKRIAALREFKAAHPDLSGRDFFQAFHAIHPIDEAGKAARARYLEAA